MRPLVVRSTRSSRVVGGRAALVASALVLGLAACVAIVASRAPAPPAAAQAAAPGPAGPRHPRLSFYDDLAPYGTWTRTMLHGWAWSPDPAIVGPDFMPYVSGGSWQPTDVGWMWMSRWDWGWAPFHYGRWIWDRVRGWLWLPDGQWAPAWVEWRLGHDYVGWAALPPPSTDPYVRQISYFMFVPRDALTATRLDEVLVPPERADDALSATRPARAVVELDGRAWYAGPPPAADEPPIALKPPHPGELPPPGVGWHPPLPPPRPLPVRAHLPGGPMPARGLAVPVEEPRPQPAEPTR